MRDVFLNSATTTDATNSVPQTNKQPAYPTTCSINMACAKPSAHITHTHRQAPATLTSSLSTHLTAITHSTTTTAPNSCHHQAVPSAHASALRPHRFQPRPQFQRRFQQTAQRRQLVVSRTSAEWWVLPRVGNAYRDVVVYVSEDVSEQQLCSPNVFRAAGSCSRCYVA